MAAKPERIKVEVTDSAEGETRTFKIILTVPSSDFQLADLLRQRGVISPINGELKQAVRVAIQNYLSGAETLISTLAKASTTTSTARNNTKQKDRNASGISPTSATVAGIKQGSAGSSN